MTMAAGTNTERVMRLEGAGGRLATKADLVELELSLTQQMARVESRLTWRMMAAMIGMSGAIITAVALIVRFL